MEKGKEPIRVKDKRHFDMDGKPRQVVEETGPGARPTANNHRGEATIKNHESSAGSASGVTSVFTDLVLSLGASGFISLGAMQNPGARKAEVNLESAASLIDILDTLHDKTRGNLALPEEKVLAETLGELKIRYVKLMKKDGAA